MTTVTLDQAMNAAAADVAALRSATGPVFDTAVAHHMKRRLRADLLKGTTRDTTGHRSRYVNYDWSDRYVTHPEHVFFDFFKGEVMNSVSRIQRGLTP